MNALFGVDGHIACNDTVSFDECTAKIQTNNLSKESAGCFFRLRYLASLSAYAAECVIRQQSLDEQLLKHKSRSEESC